MAHQVPTTAPSTPMKATSEGASPAAPEVRDHGKLVKFYHDLMSKVTGDTVTSIPPKGGMLEERVKLALEGGNAGNWKRLFGVVFETGFPDWSRQVKEIVRALIFSEIQRHGEKSGRFLRVWCSDGETYKASGRDIPELRRASEDVREEFARMLRKVGEKKSVGDNCFLERYTCFLGEFRKLIARNKRETGIYATMLVRCSKKGLQHFPTHDEENAKIAARINGRIARVETSGRSTASLKMAAAQEVLPPEIEAYHAWVEGSVTYYADGCNSATDPAIALYVQTYDKTFWGELEAHFAPGNTPVFRFLNVPLLEMVKQLLVIEGAKNRYYTTLLHLETLASELERGSLDWGRYSDDLEAFMHVITSWMPERERRDAREQWRASYSHVLPKTYRASRNQMLVKIFRFIKETLDATECCMRNRRNEGRAILDHDMGRLLAFMNDDARDVQPRTMAWLRQSLAGQPRELFDGIGQGCGDFTEYAVQKAILSLVLGETLPSTDTVPETLRWDLTRLRLVAASTTKNMFAHALQVTCETMDPVHRFRSVKGFRAFYVERVLESMGLHGSLVTKNVDALLECAANPENFTVHGVVAHQNLKQLFEQYAQLKDATHACFTPESAVAAFFRALYFAQNEELPALRGNLLPAIARAVERDATLLRQVAKVQFRVHRHLYERLVAEAVRRVCSSE